MSRLCLDVNACKSHDVTSHLIVPGFPAQHLGALEARRQTLAGERRAFWEKLHVDTLSEVDEDEAVVHVLRLETLVLQEPEKHDDSRGDANSLKQPEQNGDKRLVGTSLRAGSCRV